jgi:hypothetical protein
VTADDVIEELEHLAQRLCTKCARGNAAVPSRNLPKYMRIWHHTVWKTDGENGKCQAQDVHNLIEKIRDEGIEC